MATHRTLTIEIAPGGAEVELFSFDFTLGYGHVLARWREEWVTWRVYPSETPGEPLICEVGHYFRDNHNHDPHPTSKAAAYEDYKKRTTYAC